MLIAVTALAAGALIFCVTVLCFGKSAMRRDAVRKRIDVLSREATRASLASDSDLDRPFTERVIRPLLKKIFSVISGLLPHRKKKTDDERTLKQAKLLKQAGWTITVDEYAVIQLILMIGFGVLGLAVALLTRKDTFDVILYFVFGVFGAYTALRYFCTSAATRRKAAIEKQLPDILDLLSVSVAAGLGFERALLHVIETTDGPLTDEFAVASREMAMGRSRKDALTLLGERCGVEDLSTVTGALVQAGQLGLPICNVLQAQAEAIRHSRRSKVKEKAAKVSTKMLLPMIGLIFPVLFIILLGPSIITIMEQLG